MPRTGTRGRRGQAPSPQPASAPSGQPQGRAAEVEDAPQASLAAQAGAADGVLAARLARVRALAAPPADADAWLRCEELQDEFKAVVAGWRGWPEDGRCDASLRALALLLAAVDAAPVGLEVRCSACSGTGCALAGGARSSALAWPPLECMQSARARVASCLPPARRSSSQRRNGTRWDTRLGPAMVRSRGSIRRDVNAQLHRQLWGTEFFCAPGNDDARPPPDELLKCVGAGAPAGGGSWAAGWIWQARERLPHPHRFFLLLHFFSVLSGLS